MNRNRKILQGASVAILLISLLFWALLSSQPKINQKSANSSTVVATITYNGWENTLFYFEPSICMAGYFELNGNRIWLKENYSEKICFEKNTMDLGNFLSIGENEIKVEVMSSIPDRTPSELAFGTILLGGHWLSTLSGFGLFIVWIIILWIGMTALRFSIPPKIIISLAQVYFIFWLHFHPNRAYTNDLPEHIAYLKHMATNWLNPFAYDGYEGFHPLTYYFISGRIYNAALSFSQINPLSVIRIFSIFLYTTFILFGIRTLKNCVNTRSKTYVLGILLIVFWPASILMATRISNDILLYAVWGATYYYLSQWHQSASVKHLTIVLCLLGIAIMVKSNALTLGAIIGACVLNALLSDRVHWDDIGWPPIILGSVFIILGLTVNMGRIFFEHINLGAELTAREHFGYIGTYHPSFSHYLTLHVKEYLEWPFIRWPAERENMHFLNYFLRTTLFGEFSFAHQGLATVMTQLVFLYTMVLSTFCVILSWRHWRTMGLHIMAVGICILSLEMFMFLRNLGVCQDFRFTLPMIVPASILYVNGLEYMYTRRWLPLYWTGFFIGIALPCAGILFYVLQYLPAFIT